MKVRDLLSDESKWTKGAFARSADGISCLLESDAAICWCLKGAIFRCYPIGHGSVMARVVRRLGNALVSAWNDNRYRTFSEVKALVDELDI